MLTLHKTNVKFDFLEVYKTDGGTYWVIINRHAYPIELNGDSHKVRMDALRKTNFLDERLSDIRLQLGEFVADYSIA